MVHGQRDSEGLKASFNSIKFCERVILLIEGLQVGTQPVIDTIYGASANYSPAYPFLV